MTPVRFDVRKSLAAQLAARGVESRDIAAIVLSHFHADHIAGVLDFPDVPLFASRMGWEGMRARGPLAALRLGLLPELAPSSLAPRIRFFEDAPPHAARASTEGLRAYDILGDGSLLATALPGHAEGHFGVRFTAADDREVMLVADAAWSSWAIRENRPPPAWTTGWLGNTRAYRETLGRLHAL